MESTSLFGKAGDAEEDKDHIIGDSNSPKRYGGLWHLVTFIAVGISFTALISNLWSITEWNEIRDMYKGDGAYRPSIDAHAFVPAYVVVNPAIRFSHSFACVLMYSII